jgi:hypothetical protein
MTIKKLTKMPYAQAHVEITDGGEISLFSYVTRVAVIDEDGYLAVNGLYSMTTRKHISAFLKEYAPMITFPMVKNMIGNYKMHIECGDIIEFVGEEG